jgi:hypothetical protein
LRAFAQQKEHVALVLNNESIALFASRFP